MEQISPPSILLTATEVWRAGVELAILLLSGKVCLSSPHGNGQPVIVVPGFGADNKSTKIFRNYLRKLGYISYKWNQGHNLGITEKKVAGLAEQVLAIHKKTGQKVVIIGHSLGGVYAREIAKMHASKVAMVITLGSPINDLHVKSSILAPLYKILNPQYLDTTVFGEKLLHKISAPPPVPTTVIYSKMDGVVNWAACVQLGNHPKVENVEVRSSHCGMAMNSQVFSIIASRLAQYDDNQSTEG